MEKAIVFNLCFPKKPLSLPHLPNITNYISSLVKCPSLLEAKLNEMAEVLFNDGIRQDASCRLMEKTEYQLEDHFKLAFLTANSY
uniref:Choline/carnitine acyltransferase domain-containing protein n=1 Tax=Syphacia muris TaxID=451379 RepID=A0A0N5AVQ2_9BILA